MDTAVAPAAMLDTAGSGAAEAAARAGVDVVLLEEPWQFERGAALLASIWDAERESDVVSKEVLRALAHSGNYVAGAFADGGGRGRLVGLSAGFMGLGDGHPHLHSHISGVAADVRHRRIGFALKQHQRAWALRHGFDRVS